MNQKLIPIYIIFWVLVVLSLIVALIYHGQFEFIIFYAPLPMLLSSFLVFSRLPRGLRITHNLIVSLLLTAFIVSECYVWFWAQTEPAVSEGFIIFAALVDFAYLFFITFAAFSLALLAAFHWLTHHSSETGESVFR